MARPDYDTSTAATTATSSNKRKTKSSDNSKTKGSSNTDAQSGRIGARGSSLGIVTERDNLGMLYATRSDSED
jgi:hypothetical protein